MTIIPLSKDMRPAWDAFCGESGSAWFRHITQFLDYIINCRFDKKSRDLSFCVMQNNELIAIVPLILQTIFEYPKFYEFAFADTNTPFPAFKNGLSCDTRQGLMKVIFAEIDKLAREHAVAYSRFFLDPMTDDIIDGVQRTNPLPKFGYHETSLSTNVISLESPVEYIFSCMRKGHKSDVNAAMKDGCEVRIFSGKDITRDIFSIYRDLHFRDAGRKTRPDETWDIMYRILEEGKYVLALLKIDKKYVAGALVTVYKKKGVYASSATDPDYTGKTAVGHLLQWKIIEHLKRMEADHYETGWNLCPNISQKVVSAKEINISKFKAGFGGELYPVFRGEKFYSKEYFASTYKDRIDKYSATFDEP